MTAQRLVYLDHNATTPLHPEVQKTIRDTMEVFGNPSSMHQFGRKARKMVEDARAKVADFIGADPEEVFFVGSGSEANNTVLSIFASCVREGCSCQFKPRHEIIATEIEHPCILETSKCMNRRGNPVQYLRVDRFGKVLSEDLKEKISDQTGLVSVMLANNEIGTIQNVKEFAKIAHDAGAYFHTDAVQAVGKIPIDVKKMDVDFLTISGHKMYGPKGIGALYVKKGARFCPFIIGGHQEKGRRAGTENTLGIIALGRAVEMRAKEMNDEETRLLKLKKILRDGLEKSIPDIRFNGHPTDCLPGTLNVSFQGVEGEAVLLYLDMEGIAVSTGSACASGSLDPSHVIMATGTPVEMAHGSIRFSLGRDTTEEEIRYTVEKLEAIIKRVREMSTAY